MASGPKCSAYPRSINGIWNLGTLSIRARSPVPACRCGSVRRTRWLPAIRRPRPISTSQTASAPAGSIPSQAAGRTSGRLSAAARWTSPPTIAKPPIPVVLPSRASSTAISNRARANPSTSIWNALQPANWMTMPGASRFPTKFQASHFMAGRGSSSTCSACPTPTPSATSMSPRCSWLTPIPRRWSRRCWSRSGRTFSTVRSTWPTRLRSAISSCRP